MHLRDTLISLTVCGISAVVISAPTHAASLVAAWPLDDGPSGSAVTVADDIIDAGLTFQDATPEGSGNTWQTDADRGIVYSTMQGGRLHLGTQGINMTNGFTWSVWVKPDGSNVAEGGADSIIGSRSGVWNKFQVNGFARWVDIGGYNVDDAAWHHCVIVGNSNPIVSVYIDGAFVGSDSTLFNNIWIVNDKFELGGTSQFTEDMQGYVSDVGVWSNALTLGQIVGYYNLSSNTNLIYKAYDAQQLFDLYESQSSAPITINGTKWYYDSSSINNATNDGALFDLGDGKFELVFDSTDDSGVTMMNPGAGTILIIR